MLVSFNNFFPQDISFQSLSPRDSYSLVLGGSWSGPRSVLTLLLGPRTVPGAFTHQLLTECLQCLSIVPDT